MFRVIFSLLFSLLIINTAFAQNPPHPQPAPSDDNKIVEPPPTKFVWEITGIRPPDKNILFVIDTSGSMNGAKVQSAIRMAMSIAEAPVDDLQIAIVSFGSSTHRWPGTTDIDPNTNKSMSRNRWSVMPSKDNLDAAYSWLQANRDSGGTALLPAIHHAFNTCSGGEEDELVKDLSILIISDGAINGSYSPIELAINKHQKDREHAGLPPASIGFIGIDVRSIYDYYIKDLIGEQLPKDNPQSPIRWSADLGTLGYARIVYIKEDD
jgi:von Willebrand factor type A domain